MPDSSRRREALERSPPRCSRPSLGNEAGPNELSARANDEPGIERSRGRAGSGKSGVCSVILSKGSLPNGRQAPGGRPSPVCRVFAMQTFRFARGRSSLRSSQDGPSPFLGLHVLDRRSPFCVRGSGGGPQTGFLAPVMSKIAGRSRPPPSAHEHGDALALGVPRQVEDRARRKFDVRCFANERRSG